MMRKMVSFLILTLLSSCSFIVVGGEDLNSTHVPDADLLGVNAINKLNGTIWRKDHSHTYLFIEDSRFAIKKYAENKYPEQFPEDYEYADFGQSRPIGSQLKSHRAVIYSINKHEFIGFNLVSDKELVVSCASLENIVAFELENNRSVVWDLYIK